MGNFKTRYLPFGELPQNIVGRIISRQWKNRLEVIDDRQVAGVQELEAKHNTKIYVVTPESHKNDKWLKNINSHSCGKYICIIGYENISTVLKHEADGHVQQSKKLKWLYLPTVGVCSPLFVLWDRLFHQKWPQAKRSRWYYSRWTETWADKLAGIERVF